VAFAVAARQHDDVCRWPKTLSVSPLQVATASERQSSTAVSCTTDDRQAAGGHTPDGQQVMAARTSEDMRR